MKKVTKNLWSSLIFHTKANWLVGLILAVHGQILTFLIPVTMNTGASLSNAHT
jgi:isocitrate dehydrogenase kinase/phosphatase